jgi:hypothetical protein
MEAGGFAMKKTLWLITDEHGSIALITAFLLAVFVGVLALVIDLGHLHTVENEVRNGADACALRGARAFYADVKPYAEPADKLNAVTQAKATVGLNSSDYTQFQEILDQDILAGVWDFENRTWLYDDGSGSPVFTWPPNKADYGKIIGPGLGVAIRRSGDHNSGPVGMSLASVFGVSSVPVNRPATAALSPLGEEGEDNWDLTGQPPPLQVGDKFASNPGSNLNLSPDNTDAGGWHSYYDLKNPSTPLLQDLIWGRQTPPDLAAGAASDGGTPIERSNGVNSALFSDLPNMKDKSLYWKWMQMTGRTAAGLGPDAPAPQVWSCILPVTSSDGPFVGTAEILGFVKVTIDRVYPPNYKDPVTGSGAKADTIDVTVSQGNWVTTGKGGGRYYGIIALDPKLVQ